MDFNLLNDDFYNYDYEIQDLNSNGWRIEYNNHIVTLYDSDNLKKFKGYYNYDPFFPCYGILYWNNIGNKRHYNIIIKCGTIIDFIDDEDIYIDSYSNKYKIISIYDMNDDLV